MRANKKAWLLSLSAVALAGFMAGMVFTGGSNLSSKTQAQPAPTAAASKLLPDFASLAEQVMPAVLAVTTEEVVGGRNLRRAHPGMDPFEFFFGRPRPRQRAIGMGSAFFISPDGLALTNNHVVQGAEKIFAFTTEQTRYEAKVVGRDPATDLALIKVQGKGPFPFLTLGDSDALRVGEWVMAVGNPLGVGQTVTVGVVSGKGRSLNLSEETASFENFIQTDAAINRGNSGGPLVNIKGEVVGINTAMNMAAENMGFAVPVNTAKAILPQLKEKGRVSRGYLGVLISNVSQEAQDAFGLPSREGALVQEVTEGSPAEKAGLKHGDVIVAVNGKSVKNQRELIDTVASMAPGTKVQVEVIRDGKRKTFTATLAERPNEAWASEKEEAREGASQLGLEVNDITPALRRRFDIPPSVNGVLVLDVEQLSPADDAGISPGDVILELNGQEVISVEDFNKTLEKIRKGQAIRLYVWHKGSKRFVVLRKP